MTCLHPLCTSTTLTVRLHSGLHLHYFTTHHCKKTCVTHASCLQRPAQFLIPSLCVNCAACNTRPVLYFLPCPALPWITWQTSVSPSRKSAHSSTRRTASVHWERSRSCCVSATRISLASMTFSEHGTLTKWEMCILSCFTESASVNLSASCTCICHQTLLKT